MGIRWPYGVLALASLGAAPSETPAVAPDVHALPPAPDVDATPAPLLHSPWPELAAVFPGVLMHGFGTFLQGRQTTSERLLMLEGASLLALAADGRPVWRFADGPAGAAPFRPVALEDPVP